MFDAVARHYDRMNKFMSLGMDQDWRRFLIEGLEVRPPVRFRPASAALPHPPTHPHDPSIRQQ